MRPLHKHCLYPPFIVSYETMHEKSFTAPEPDGGSRLDAFLARALACGARGAKRRIENGRVLVNGKARMPHYKISAGDLITVAAERVPSSSLAESVRLVAANGEYAAFAKPAGLHTTRVSGGTAENLEDILAREWPVLREPLVAEAPLPRLLGRLDNPTSGLVLAAFTPRAAERYRGFEAEGKVDKRYLAVVRGAVAAPFVMKNDLDTDGRRKTRVRDTFCPDAARHTAVTPLRPAARLAPYPATHRAAEAVTAATLAEARIKRGARHQIRAHLAHAGFPILGDPLYGLPGDALPLFLHHERLEFPGFSASCPPPWPPV